MADWMDEVLDAGKATKAAAPVVQKDWMDDVLDADKPQPVGDQFDSSNEAIKRALDALPRPTPLKAATGALGSFQRGQKDVGPMAEAARFLPIPTPLGVIKPFNNPVGSVALKAYLTMANAAKSVTEQYDPDLGLTKTLAGRAISLMSSTEYALASPALDAVRAIRNDKPHLVERRSPAFGGGLGADVAERAAKAFGRGLSGKPGDKPTFVDVALETGLPPAVAIPLGLLGSLATPIGPVPARFFSATRTGKLAQKYTAAKKAAEEAGETFDLWKLDTEKMSRSQRSEIEAMKRALQSGESLKWSDVMSEQMRAGHRRIVEFDMNPTVVKANAEMGRPKSFRLNPETAREATLEDMVRAGFADPEDKAATVENIVERLVPQPTLPMTPERVAEWNTFRKEAEALVERKFPTTTAKPTREVWTPFVAWDHSGFGVLPGKLGRTVNASIVEHAERLGKGLREFDPNDVSAVGRVRQGVAKGADVLGGLFNTRHIPLDSNGKIVLPSQARALARLKDQAAAEIAHGNLLINEAATGLSKEPNYGHKIIGPALTRLEQDGKSNSVAHRLLRWLSDKPLSDEAARDIVDLTENGIRGLPQNPKEVDHWLRQGLMLDDASDMLVSERLTRQAFIDNPGNWTAQLDKLAAQINKVDAKTLELERIRDVAEATKNQDVVLQSEERLKTLYRGRVVLDDAYQKMTGKPFDPEDVLTRQAGPVTFDPDITVSRADDTPVHSRMTKDLAEKARGEQVDINAARLREVKANLVRADAASKAIIRTVSNAVDAKSINRLKKRLEWMTQRMRALKEEQAEVMATIEVSRRRRQNTMEIDRALDDFDGLYERRRQDEIRTAIEASERSPVMQEPAAIIPGYRKTLEHMKENDPEGYKKAINKTTVGDWLRQISPDDEAYARRLTSYLDYRTARANAQAAKAEGKNAYRATQKRATAVKKVEAELLRRSKRQVLRPPRVPLDANGMPVPSPKPVKSPGYSAADPPTPEDFVKNVEKNGSTTDLIIQGFQDEYGNIGNLDARREWLRGVLKAKPEIVWALSREIVEDLKLADPRHVSKMRMFQMFMAGELMDFLKRVKGMGRQGEYVSHASGPLVRLSAIFGSDLFRNTAPKFTLKRHTKETMLRISEALETVGQKSPFSDRHIVKNFIDYSRQSLVFNTAARLLDRTLSTMGMTAQELLSRMEAARVRAPKDTAGLRNFYNSSFMLEMHGGGKAQVKYLRGIENELNRYGVAAHSNIAKGKGAQGVGLRLVDMARKGSGGTIPTKIVDGKSVVDLSPEIEQEMVRRISAMVQKDIKAGVTGLDDANAFLGHKKLVDVTNEGVAKQLIPKRYVQKAADDITNEIRVLEKKRQELAPGISFVVNKYWVGEALNRANVEPEAQKAIFQTIAAMEDGTDLRNAYYVKLNADSFEEAVAALGPAGGQVFVIPDGVEKMLDGTFNSVSKYDRDFLGLLHFLQKSNAVYKAIQTVWAPAYHVRNALSNAYVIHNIAEARDPWIWKTGADVVGQVDGGFSGSLGKYYRHADVMKEMRKHGLVGVDFSTEVGRELFGRGTVATPNILLEKINPVTYGRMTGSAIELHARAALFSHFLREGFQPFDAAMAVKKYLFDYSDLTTFERDFMRLLFPFYTFSRKNLPLQVEALIKNPQLIANPARIQNAVSKAINGEPMTAAEQELMPDYLEGRMAIKYKDRDDQTRLTPLVGYMNTTSDVAQLALRGAPYLAEQTSPLPTFLMNQAYNKDFRTGFRITSDESGMGGILSPETDVTEFMGTVMGRRKENFLRLFRPFSLYNSLIGDKYKGNREKLKLVLGFQSYEADFVKWRKQQLNRIDREISSIRRDRVERRKLKGGDKPDATKLHDERIERLRKERDRILQ